MLFHPSRCMADSVHQRTRESRWTPSSGAATQAREAAERSDAISATEKLFAFPREAVALHPCEAPRSKVEHRRCLNLVHVELAHHAPPRLVRRLSVLDDVEQ